MCLQECHLCRGPAQCYLRVGLCSGICQASGCHTLGLPKGRLLPPAHVRELDHISASVTIPLMVLASLAALKRDGSIPSLASASFSRCLSLLLGSREGCKDEKYNNAPRADDLESLFMILRINYGLSYGPFFRIIHTDHLLPVTLLHIALKTATITMET